MSNVYRGVRPPELARTRGGQGRQRELESWASSATRRSRLPSATKATLVPGRFTSSSASASTTGVVLCKPVREKRVGNPDSEAGAAIGDEGGGPEPRVKAVTVDLRLNPCQDHDPKYLNPLCLTRTNRDTQDFRLAEPLAAEAQEVEHLRQRSKMTAPVELNASECPKNRANLNV